MAKKIKEEIGTEKTYLIWKAENYKDSKMVLPLDKDRIDKFNLNEKIEVTLQELNEIGYHRWLISEVK